MPHAPTPDGPDASEARRTEQELRESRERFQRIAESAYDMIVECDPDWRIVYGNGRVTQVLGTGRPRDFADGEHLHPEDRARAIEAFSRVHSGEADMAQVVFRSRHADGSWRWLETTLRPIVRGEARHLLMIGRDVTGAVQAQERLRESERRYRDLVESAPLGIFVTQDGRVVYANPAGAGIAGCSSPEEIVGHELTAMIPPQHVEEVGRRMSEAPPGARTNAIDFEIVGIDGRRRRVQGAANAISYRGRPAFQAVLRDVTEVEESRLERERLQLQLQEARKLESLGVLAGGIAHDFNNLLAVILSNVRYAREQETGSVEGREALEDAEEAAESAARLVRQLLDYAGRRAPEVRSVDLSEVVESVSELLGSALPRGVSISLELSPELHVYADLVQLEQVLMNLVLNAAEAMDARSGAVVVRTRRIRLGDREAPAWRGGESLAPGDYACLEVEDAGAGMSDPVRQRIFDPFFSTKPGGHGLGLSAVLGTVQGHRGAIEVRSAPGRGTCIRIALPLEPATPGSTGAGAPLVLVADADPELRERIAGALEGLGARTCEAGDAEGLRGLWAMHAEELDAAVLGAGLLGPGAAPERGPLEARPELPILLLDSPEAAPELRARALAALPRGAAPGTLRERLKALLEKLRD